MVQRQVPARVYEPFRFGTCCGISGMARQDSTSLRPRSAVAVPSIRRGHWITDAYGGGWFFTKNHQFFSINAAKPNIQSEGPIGAIEMHLSYDVKPRLWASIDGNFWYGGRTALNGVENDSTLQTSSRIGATCSIPLSKHQSVKFSYSDGTYVRYGGNFSNVSVAWQYSWLGRPN